MPAGSGGDDFVGIGGPDEGLWLLVVVDDEAVDGGLKVDDAFEDAALEAALGEDGEEAVAVAATEDAGRVGSHRFLTCVADPNRASADFLRYWFLSEEGLLALNRASPGGAGRNRTLGIKALEAITVLTPSLDAQRWFDRLQVKARAARAAQTEAATHVARLLPAMLHELFN